jgi:hypothetical protein
MIGARRLVRACLFKMLTFERRKEDIWSPFNSCDAHFETTYSLRPT